METSLIDEAVRHFSTAMANALLYGPQHLQVTVHAGKAAAKFGEIAGTTGEVKLVLVDELLFHGGRPLEKNLFVNRLIQAMKRRTLGYLLFLQGIDGEEIRGIASILSGKTKDENLSRGHFRFGMVELASDGEEEGKEISSFEKIPKKRMQEIVETYRCIDRGGKTAISGLAAIVAGFLNGFRKEANPFLALAPLRAMDEYTFAHSVNVGILNLAQGMLLGIDGQLLHNLGIAGMLHDAGKLHVPKRILQKPGELTAEEWEEMKRHPACGAAYLLSQPDVPRLAALAAFEHHMGHDVSGYPRVSAGWEPNLCSDMTMISDCFDALRTERVYQNGLDFEKTAGIMLGFAGTHLHPFLTMNFLRGLHKFEPGISSTLQAIA